jgi:putative SOS response-associated peptidase YedK
MCGRFTLTTPAGRLADQFELTGELPEVPPSYNIVPTQEIAAVALDSDGNRKLRALY